MVVERQNAVGPFSEARQKLGLRVLPPARNGGQGVEDSEVARAFGIACVRPRLLIGKPLGEVAVENYGRWSKLLNLLESMKYISRVISLEPANEFELFNRGRGAQQVFVECGPRRSQRAENVVHCESVGRLQPEVQPLLVLPGVCEGPRNDELCVARALVPTGKLSGSNSLGGCYVVFGLASQIALRKVHRVAADPMSDVVAVRLGVPVY